MKELAPIVLFVYNRPEHTKETLIHLQKNELANDSHLYIFSDGAKNDQQKENVDKVRKVIREFNGFKSVNITESNENKGLANSIISGIDEIINKYGKVIVLEDDLKTSKYFLTYMNNSLTFYNNENIWSISGYTPPIDFPEYYNKDVYAVLRACSWGWATWKSKWNLIDWEIKDYRNFKQNKKEISEFKRSGNDMNYMLQDQINGHIDSWAIRWCYNQFKYKNLTIYPTQSFVSNVGVSGSGTHGSFRKDFNSLLKSDINISLEHINEVDPVILKRFTKFYNMRLYNYIGRGLKKVHLYKIVKKISKKIIR